MDTVAIVEAFGPVVAVGLVLLAAIVAAVNALGRKLDRHDEWFRLLSLRVDNLHAERAARVAQSLQRPPPEPPPLSDAKTVEIDESLLLTLKRETRRER